MKSPLTASPVSARRIRSSKDAPDSFVKAFAKSWYTKYRTEILMQWFQGFAASPDACLRAHLRRFEVKTDWQDARLGAELVKIMTDDINGG